MSLQKPAQESKFVHTGVLGLDEILGGRQGHDGLFRGRLQGERILIVGPPGAGKTLLALSLIEKALGDSLENDSGLFLTTEQAAGRLIDSVSGLSILDVPPSRLNIVDFPPYHPPYDLRAHPNDQEMINGMLDRLGEQTHTMKSPPRHIVLDGLTAMQAVLSSQAEARRLTYQMIANLSWPREGPGSFDLIVMTAEAHPGFTTRNSSEQSRASFDDYLFDTVLYLDIIEMPADRRLRTIEILKSRGRHARTGRHTFSIVSQNGLSSLIRSKAAYEEIRQYDTPIIIFPREPRSERPLQVTPPISQPKAEYLKTGTDGLDTLLDRNRHRGLLKRSITVLIGGPGTGSSLVGLRYLAKGLEDNLQQPVLLISFGRDHEDFARLANNFPWLRASPKPGTDTFHFLYYRPVNLDQNRLFYEIRKEIQTYQIDRVLIDSISSLPLVDIDTETSSDFLVTLIGLLKELRCTAMLTHVADRSPEPLSAPGRFISSLADNIFILNNVYTPKEEMKKTLSILKARGTDAISQEVEFSIGEELGVRPFEEG